jgi:hypothetical protein
MLSLFERPVRPGEHIPFARDPNVQRREQKDEVAEAIQRDEDAWGLHWRGEDQGELNLLKRDCLLLPDESAACYQLFWLDHFQSLYLDKVTLVEGGHRTSAL